MKKKLLYKMLAFLILASMLLGCAGIPNSNANLDRQAIESAVAATIAAQPAQPPAATDAPTASGADTSAPEGTMACKNGKPLPNLLALIPDVPWGAKEGATVAEIAYKGGKGHGDWGRFIAVAEKLLSNEMPYAVGVDSASATLYCGDIQTVLAYAPNHANAMAQYSGADVNEISVVFLHRDGTVEFIKKAPNGPSETEIRSHLEMREDDPNNTGEVPGTTAFSGIGASDTAGHEGTNACVDGFVLPPTNITNRVPFGSTTGAVVAEMTYQPGPGYADYGRFITIVERMTNGREAYALDLKTIHATTYCGELTAIVEWSATHVTALVNSSQNSAGDRPTIDEIPIVFLRNDGSIEMIKTAPDGPSLDEIKAHLEMRP